MRVSGPIEVDAASLFAAARNVRTAQDDIASVLNSVVSTASGASGAWQGQAAAGFQGVMDRWVTDVRVVLGALGEIGGLLNAAGQRHTTTDEEQRGAFAALEAAFNPGGATR
jgi:WXG100 family type VII secretion target